MKSDTAERELSKSPLKDFLGEYAKKPRTIATYQSGIRAFLDNVYGIDRKNPKGENQRKEKSAEYERLAVKYLSEDRDHGNDLKTFALSFIGKPGYTARIYLTGTKEFLGHYDIELNHKEKKTLRRSMPKATRKTIEKELNLKKLRSIFSQMDLKGKALYLMLLSSGMRIGEALQLQDDDIDMESSPVKITLRSEYTKNSEPRDCFISDEAKETLLEWLKIRSQYMDAAQKRNAGLIKKGRSYEKDKDDQRVFPFSDTTASSMWQTALRKSGYESTDKATDRLQIHPHMLRKYFRTNLALVIPLDVVEALMGHEGYLTQSYRDYSDDQLREYYKKGEPVLTLFLREDVQTKTKLEEIVEELAELKARETMRAEINRVGANLDMEKIISEMADLKAEVAKMKSSQ